MNTDETDLTENTVKMELLHKDLTDKIIQVFFKVYRELGYGFLEKVYHNAMLIELNLQGFDCQSQQKINVYYHLLTKDNRIQFYPTLGLKYQF